MKKVFIGAVILTGAMGGIGLFYAFWQQNTSTSPAELESVVIHLKWQHQAQFAGIYAAKENGLYKEQGIVIAAMHEGGPSNPPIPAVLSGEADFGIAGADDVLVAIAEGKPIKAIAAIYQESPVVYFSLKESGIEKPQDFAGRRVGVREGTGTYYTYVAMMNNLGIDRNSVVEVPADAQDITPLLAKEVDVWPGFRTNEPKVAERMGYEINLIKPEDFGVDIYADVLIATQDTIQQNPALVHAFVKATLAGWEWTAENQEEATDIVMRYAHNTSKDHQKDMLQTSLELIKPSSATEIGQMNFSKWNRTYALLRQYDVIPTDITVNEAYTREFINNQ